MKKPFLDQHFLLHTPTAQHLYHSVAKDLPIIDYHNHLSAQDIYHDIHYRSIADAWLSHDHYVWRAMRSNGVDEHYITGDASDFEKFEKWCETVPYLIGNPFYHWAHMELQRYFGITELICPENCDQIWQQCNEQISGNGFSTQQLLERMNVESLCTTDDPLSDLRYHRHLAETDFSVKVLPTFRADDVFNIDNSKKFVTWVAKLASTTDSRIQNIDELFKALTQRFDYFHQHGCRLSDLGLKTIPYADGTLEDANQALIKVLAGKPLSDQEIQQFKTQLFLFLGQKNHDLGWVMQIHIGVLQDTNKRRFEQLGGATGFSAIDDTCIAQNLGKLLSSLDYQHSMPKTILYCLNPKDNYVLGAMIGAFQDSDCGPGKIQLGAAWWFNDQKDGIINQLKTLGNLGALGRFVGMLTDSRSFLSYPRHEYFRRILCNLIGEWVEQGELPEDKALLERLISDICYRNAKGYFDL